METDPDWTDMLRTKFTQSLKSFASSSDTFKVLHTITARDTTPNTPAKTLYILDSSFNPPTTAHLALARSALLNDHGARPARLLLLLATENADKKPKPASFEDRLVMMALMCSALRNDLDHHRPQTDSEKFARMPENLEVDVAVTKKPFFMDKASSIDDSGVYGADVQQVHVTGYDTIIRIFNPKYYPEDRKLGVLEPFLSKHRLRVCCRGGDGEGGVSREEQRAYVDGIGDGSRADEGMRREWRERIELVEDESEEVVGVSSTRAREVAVRGDKEELQRMVGWELAEYVLRERLYE